MVIITLPMVGIVAYVLLGETNIGRGRVRRMREVLGMLPDVKHTPGTEAANWPEIPERYTHLFRVGHSVNGFEPVGGNQARLLPDSNATIESLVADIDAAKDHVHLIFYIWLPDNNGLKVVEALKRAAARKVTCRVMADGLGSRIMIDSEHWKGMRDAGVQVAIALPIGNPLLRPLQGRIDLRNHRKIVVIDDLITYCGSQNCADPEFRIKAKYAPWVDAMMRFEGPIARQNQHLFAGDWMAHVDEDIRELLRRPLLSSEPGFAAQVIRTGPTVRYSAMPEVFETLCIRPVTSSSSPRPITCPMKRCRPRSAPVSIVASRPPLSFRRVMTPLSCRRPVAVITPTYWRPGCAFSNSKAACFTPSLSRWMAASR